MDEELRIKLEHELKDGVLTLSSRYYSEYLQTNPEHAFKSVEILTEMVNIELYDDLWKLFNFKYKEAQVNLWKLENS